MTRVVGPAFALKIMQAVKEIVPKIKIGKPSSVVALYRRRDNEPSGFGVYIICDESEAARYRQEIWSSIELPMGAWPTGASAAINKYAKEMIWKIQEQLTQNS